MLCGKGDGLLTLDLVQHIAVNFDEDVTYTDDIVEYFSNVDVSESCVSGDNDYSTAKQKSAFFSFPSEIFSCSTALLIIFQGLRKFLII